MIRDGALEAASALAQGEVHKEIKEAMWPLPTNNCFVKPDTSDVSDGEVFSEHIEIPESERIDLTNIPIEKIPMGNKKKYSMVALTGHNDTMKQKRLMKRRKKNKMAKKSRRRNR